MQHAQFWEFEVVKVCAICLLTKCGGCGIIKIPALPAALGRTKLYHKIGDLSIGKINKVDPNFLCIMPKREKPTDRRHPLAQKKGGVWVLVVSVRGLEPPTH